MIIRRKKLQVLFLLVFFLLVFFLRYGFAQQIVPEEQSQVAQAEKEQEKIVPSPKNIKESAGIYVFVAWIWLAIFVLIYILRLKIKEVDRLHQIRYFSGKRK